MEMGMRMTTSIHESLTLGVHRRIWWSESRLAGREEHALPHTKWDIVIVVIIHFSRRCQGFDVRLLEEEGYIVICSYFFFRRLGHLARALRYGDIET
jgi:hypothetical protein